MIWPRSNLTWAERASTQFSWNGWSGILFLENPTLTASNLKALWPTESILLIQKDLTPFPKYSITSKCWWLFKHMYCPLILTSFSYDCYTDLPMTYLDFKIRDTDHNKSETGLCLRSFKKMYLRNVFFDRFNIRWFIRTGCKTYSVTRRGFFA